MEGSCLSLRSPSQNLQALPFGRTTLRLANFYPGFVITSRQMLPPSVLETGVRGASLPKDSSCTHRTQGSLLESEEEVAPIFKVKARRGEAALPRLNTNRLSYVSESPGSPSPPSPPPPVSLDWAHRFFLEHLPLTCLWGHLLSQRKEDGWEGFLTSLTPTPPTPPLLAASPSLTNPCFRDDAISSGKFRFRDNSS